MACRLDFDSTPEAPAAFVQPIVEADGPAASLAPTPVPQTPHRLALKTHDARRSESNHSAFESCSSDEAQDVDARPVVVRTTSAASLTFLLPTETPTVCDVGGLAVALQALSPPAQVALQAGVAVVPTESQARTPDHARVETPRPADQRPGKPKFARRAIVHGDGYDEDGTAGTAAPGAQDADDVVNAMADAMGEPVPVVIPVTLQAAATADTATLALSVLRRRSTRRNNGISNAHFDAGFTAPATRFDAADVTRFFRAAAAERRAVPLSYLRACAAAGEWLPVAQDALDRVNGAAARSMHVVRVAATNLQCDVAACCAPTSGSGATSRGKQLGPAAGLARALQTTAKAVPVAAAFTATSAGSVCSSTRIQPAKASRGPANAVTTTTAAPPSLLNRVHAALHVKATPFRTPLIAPAESNQPAGPAATRPPAAEAMAPAPVTAALVAAVHAQQRVIAGHADSFLGFFDPPTAAPAPPNVEFAAGEGPAGLSFSMPADAFDPTWRETVAAAATAPSQRQQHAAAVDEQADDFAAIAISAIDDVVNALRNRTTIAPAAELAPLPAAHRESPSELCARALALLDRFDAQVGDAASSA